MSFHAKMVWSVWFLSLCHIRIGHLASFPSPFARIIRNDHHTVTLELAWMCVANPLVSVSVRVLVHPLNISTHNDLEATFGRFFFVLLSVSHANKSIYTMGYVLHSVYLSEKSGGRFENVLYVLHGAHFILRVITLMHSYKFFIYSERVSTYLRSIASLQLTWTMCFI